MDKHNDLKIRLTQSLTKLEEAQYHKPMGVQVYEELSSTLKLFMVFFEELHQKELKNEPIDLKYVDEQVKTMEEFCNSLDELLSH